MLKIMLSMMTSGVRHVEIIVQKTRRDLSSDDALIDIFLPLSMNRNNQVEILYYK